MDIIILDNKDSCTFSEINGLTKSVGWGNCYYKTELMWKKIIQRSTHVVFIKDRNNLIGFGRVLEDGMMCMFYDICIHPDYQGQKIGTTLMNHLIDKIKDNAYISIGLFWEGNNSVNKFYETLGFVGTNAMELTKYMTT